MGKNNRKDFNKKSNSPIYDEDLNKKYLGHTQNKAKDTSYTKSEPRKKERPVVEPDDVMKQLIDKFTLRGRGGGEAPAVRTAQSADMEPKSDREGAVFGESRFSKY